MNVEKVGSIIGWDFKTSGYGINIVYIEKFIVIYEVTILALKYIKKKDR